MRIGFRFRIHELPIGYRLGVLSIIKEMVRSGSEKYFEEIFVKNKDEMKPFGYSTYIKNIVINDQKIKGDELIVTVSSSSYEWMMHLINGSRKKKEYWYQDYSFTLISKRLLPICKIDKRIVTFSTKSPILLESKEKKPVLFFDEDFEKEFQYASSLLIEQLYHRKPFEPIRVLQTAMKKQVIKEYLHQVHGDPLYLTTSRGLIQLEGHQEDLQAIYDNGIGFRRSLGLGLLDVEGVTSNEWNK